MFDTALAGCFVVDRKAWEKIGVERLNTKLRPKAIPNNINCFLIQSKYKYYDIYYGKWYYVVFLTHNLQIHDLVIKFSKAPFRVNVKKKLEDFIFNTANIETKETVPQVNRNTEHYYTFCYKSWETSPKEILSLAALSLTITAEKFSQIWHLFLKTIIIAFIWISAFSQNWRKIGFELCKLRK